MEMLEEERSEDDFRFRLFLYEYDLESEVLEVVVDVVDDDDVVVVVTAAVREATHFS